MYLPFREPLVEPKNREHAEVIAKVKHHSHSHTVSLKDLYFCRFGNKIQTGYHSSDEDTHTTMELLYKSVQVMWERDVRRGHYCYVYPRRWARRHVGASVSHYSDAGANDSDASEERELVTVLSSHGGRRVRVPL